MSLTIRNTTFDAGSRPKICSPITASSSDMIIEICQNIVNEQSDMIEWRADHYLESDNIEKVYAVLKQLRLVASDKPILFTYRSKAEGGESDAFYSDSQSDKKYIDYDSYVNLLLDVSLTGDVDLVDIELDMLQKHNDKISKDLIKKLQGNGCHVVVSKHYFDKTPANQDIEALFTTMNDSGADMLKLAVMPKSRNDVLRLIEATGQASTKFNKPVITMSMGSMGLSSRIIGQLTGSVITFASVGEASAPGQIPASKMKYLLELLDFS